MKKLLTTFIIGCIGLISFCNGVLYTVDSETLNCENGAITYDLSGLPTTIGIKDLGDGGNYNLCFTCENNVSGRCGNTLVQGGYTSYLISNSLTVGCGGNGISKVVITCRDNGDDFSIIYTGNNCPCGGTCPTCPSVDTGAILSGYILESSIDSEYCVSNDLCPSSDCPVYTGDSNWSSLYINDIQHEGAGIINITIPEEFSWDYTGDDEEFNLNVIGYNVDTAYIEGIISNQTTKPNQTDLNNIITGVIPLFVPGLVVILFIYFIFKFLKKIF